ncbi:hypothetical protein CEXT_778641 [Caerostris extrusa]|uniref:Uncharacterized protein n=1 Tax=Caerostris extrusa TaxID=172846 RepID=A0AAV4VQU1_CAEEX|nr:hypothetical protein CEXT_778641 [Caerostris extrusa]
MAWLSLWVLRFETRADPALAMTKLIRTISRRMLLLSHPVQNGVGHRRRHRRHVADGKGQIQSLCTHDVGMELGKKIQAIPWQPADGEHHGNVQQHHGGPGDASQISLQPFMVDRSALALLVSLCSGLAHCPCGRFWHSGEIACPCGLSGVPGWELRIAARGSSQCTYP